MMNDIPSTPSGAVLHAEHDEKRPSAASPMSTKAAAYAALLLAVTIWGINFHSVYIGLLHFSVFGFLTLRFTLASVLYAPKLLRMRRQPLPLDASRSKHPISQRGFMLSALGVALALAAFYSLQSVAIRGKYGTVNAAFLTATAVVWVPLISKMVFPNRTIASIDVVIGILLIALGIAVIEGVSLATVRLGDILALCGAVALAIELIIVGEVSPRLTPHRLIVWTATYTAIAAVIMAVLWIALDPRVVIYPPGQHVDKEVRTQIPQWIMQSPIASIVALLFTASAATALANWLANWANSQRTDRDETIITATHRGVMENLDAPIAMMVGVAVGYGWLAKPVDWTYGGYCLVVAGVLVAELRLASRYGKKDV